MIATLLLDPNKPVPHPKSNTDPNDSLRLDLSNISLINLGVLYLSLSRSEASNFLA